VRIRLLTFPLLSLLFLTTPTLAQSLTFGNAKLQLTLDYNAKATVSALTVNGEKVIDGPEGIYSEIKTKTATYSTLHLLATPVAAKMGNIIVVTNIVYGDKKLKITETWHFIITNDNIKFNIDRTLSKPVQIEQASLPVFTFKNINTWEGAYQDYGGLAWFYLFNKRSETYGVHSSSSKFWNSKTNNGLTVAVDAPGKQVAMSYSRTMTDQLAYSISVAQNEILPRFDSGTNRRRFLRDSTNIWAPIQANPGKTSQSITLSYFDFNKTYGRGQLTGINGDQVSAVLNTIARIGVIDKQHFGGNSWHTPYGPICLHEQYIAQLGLAMDDPDYLKGYKQCLDFYRDNAIKPDGRVWPRWAYTNEDAMPGAFTDKGFYEAQWGYLLDANPDLVTNVAELYDQTGDLPWVKKHQASCEKALDWICKRDSNDNGLVEMITDSHEQKRGSDWIDIIWASYENAFVNAKLYHALVLWTAIENRLGNPNKATYYQNFAQKLKASFNKPIDQGGFWDGQNSCYVHWREKDGSIHGDNMVTPVNFMAIGYGICDDTVRRNAILDKIEARMQKEKLFFWPLCLSTYQKGDGNDWQFPFPNYENGDIFLSWGALGVKAYADYKPEIALKYVKNVLAQYAKDGLAFQRYGRTKQDGLGDDILAGNSLSVVGLYQAIYGLNPLYNRLYLNPHLTKDLAGTKLNYNFRGQKLIVDLSPDNYTIRNNQFSITSTKDFGFYAGKDTLMYFDRASDKPALRIETNGNLAIDIKAWTPDHIRWSQSSTGRQIYYLDNLIPNSTYTLSADNKPFKHLQTTPTGELQFGYTGNNPEFTIEPSAITQLKANFLTPPDSTRPGVYWYFMDGNRSAQSTTEDLEAMKKAGIGSVIFLEVNVGIPRGKVDFFSTQWQDLFTHAVREAERLGIQMTLGIGPGWSGSGGPWVTPEQSMQHLVCSSTQITGGGDAKPIILPVPPSKKPYFGEDGLTPELKRQWQKFYTDVAVLAFPTPPRTKKIEDIDEKALYYRAPFSSVPGVKPYLPSIAVYESLPADEIIDSKQLIDLTGKLHPDGTLDWKAPPGNWTILRFVARNNGAVTRPAPYPGLGFESDKFDTAALDAHLDHYVGALIRRIGIPDSNKAGGLKRLHMDSWEMGAQNWTPNFRNEFIKRRGYDPLPYYPVYNGDIIGSLQKSEQFLWDLRQTAQELVLDYHARHLKAFAHKNNLRLSIEPYDMNPTADLELGSVADIPMAEFWSKDFGYNTSFSVIEATSIGHVNGISLVQAEAFTAADNEAWRQYPGSMKEQGDWAFAAGITRFFYHTFQSQTLPDSLKPGMTMGPYGVHWDRNQTWWPLVKSYHTYISRCQYILQQGKPVADILYLTPEGAPQVFQPPYSALKGEEPERDRRGYNFDGCSPSQLTNATVINKNIVFPGGATYRLLVLPNTPRTTPALAAKIASLKAEGATIISPQPKADSLYPDYESTATLLRQMQLAEDFESTGALRYTHRTSPDYDIYFVANKTGYDLQTSANFRCTTGRPELWDPITGETRALPEYTRQDQQTTIPLQFAAYQSFFIVFNRDTTTNTPQQQTNFPVTTTTATLAPSWTVSFDPKWGGPSQIKFDSLEDWTHRPEPGIKYYSGIATYKQTFTQTIIPKHTRIYLDLGQVHDLARVTLNGKNLGTLWTAPYKVDITTALKQGDNQLQIEVANRWPNRLIGDQQLPDDGIVNDQWPQWLLQGKPRPGSRFTFTTFNPYQKESPLLPSGLIGPVTILQTTDKSKRNQPKHKEPKIVNIVNFIRLLEPRDSAITEDVLYQTVVKQLALMRQYHLGGTFLLQYDALLDKRYQTLLRSLPKDSFEIGAWWEIPQPLVERSGMKWRGRYPWDWRANIGFSTGYTPKEREKLIDTYMRDFKNIFGYYPRSVASWFIDAYSLDYMYRKYHIVASANCKDQYGTDGYTLWGGYWNQAYYPSRKNSYMPAQHEQNQIPVPIFRMLGSDPVRQYDNGLGTTRQGVVTLEPVYKFGGGDSTWVNWFLKTFTDDESLGFNYTQAGQENSFTWNAMAKGLEIQFPVIARLRDEGRLKVETLEATGRWFKKNFRTTPATAFAVAKDIDTSTLKTAWFDSRYYRTNLLWENGSLRIRDIHLFNEDLPSIYTTQTATTNECTFFTLPVIDGYLWSKPGQLAGARLMAAMNGGEQLIIGGDPIFSSPDSGTLHITWPLKTVDGTLEINLNEKQFSLQLNTNKQLEWYFQLTTADSTKLPFTRIEPQTLYGRFEGMNYSVKAENGFFSKQNGSSAIRISPQKNKITLDMGQR
jgi:hypothetical protein